MKKTLNNEDGMGKKWCFSEPYLREIIKEEYEKMLPTLFSYVDHYASEKPESIAINEYETGVRLTWAKFQQSTKAFAAQLMAYGIQKGDVVATSLPFLKEHCFLMYACFRIGAIFAPLDLRLTTKEINENFERVKPKMYVFLGDTPVKDFRPIVKEVMKSHSTENGGSVHLWVQVQKNKGEGILDGAIHILDFVKNIKLRYIWNMLKEYAGYGVYGVERTIDKRDPAVIIFTTGSTGCCKPALLCHEGILIQNLSIGISFFGGCKQKYKQPMNLLVNLPPSHVGGLTEQFFTSVFVGEACTIISVFDAKKSLDAISKYRLSGIAQIPALFNLEWNLDDYDSPSAYDLSSLKLGVYGGQAVSKRFLEKVKVMCNDGLIGTGLGLTEMSGFCTYTNLDASVDEILESIGFDQPISPISIRAPMLADGSAGDVLPEGSIGEVCYEGPQIFLGYYGMPEKTRETLSIDGILYTGDMGSYDSKGLHFVSRRKFVIKPKGYQVFPPEVEDFILTSFKNEIEFCAIVGVEHETFTEMPVAAIKCKKGKIVLPEVVMEKCKEIANFKRPGLVFEVEGEFPLNRVKKTDYSEIIKMAKEKVQKEREEGRWDQN